MLLLVLILVLVSFALLVVALVQGNVVWAWLSVAICVAAAGALLVDWWQRQQALRAEEAPPPAPRGAPRLPPPRGAEIDSVTEFIPVVPPQGYGMPQAGAETYVFPGGPGARSTTAPSSAPYPEVEETVLLPVARPPGSAEQPPGATPPAAAWSAGSSQNVTESAAEDRTETTVAPGDVTVVKPVDAQDPVAPGADVGPIAQVPGEQVPGGQVPGGQVPGGQVPGAQGPAFQPDVTSVAPIGSGDEPPLREADALPPAGADGEPPEEPLVPAAAAIVAELQDEVVVVDERPRYHVAGCSFLPGRPTIPLPVAEAVELGFGPCGWCTPNDTLADRHRTAAR